MVYYALIARNMLDHARELAWCVGCAPYDWSSELGVGGSNPSGVANQHRHSCYGGVFLPANCARLVKRNNTMKLEQLRTVSVVRPGKGKRYSLLPVDRVDVTGFYASYANSPMQPTLLDIREGDLVFWYDRDTRYVAYVDEVAQRPDTLQVAFRDVHVAEPEW